MPPCCVVSLRFAYFVCGLWDTPEFISEFMFCSIAWRTLCACLAYVFAFVVRVCVFSCFSGSGHDGDAHAYHSSGSENFVLNIVVFLLIIVWRMRL